MDRRATSGRRGGAGLLREVKTGEAGLAIGGLFREVARGRLQQGASSSDPESTAIHTH